MMRRLPLTAAIFTATLALFGSGCGYLKARDELNKGVASMRGAKFKDAAEHFKSAMELDPSWDVPRLYLATSYMSQWIPGAESPENQEFAKNAREGFLKVLESSPQDKTSLASLASMAFSEATTGTLTPEEKNKKLDESAEWHKKHIAVEPTAEHYYSLAVINFTKWVPDWLAARSAAKMRQDEPGPLKDAKARAALKEKDGMLVDEAIGYLRKALELDPEYENAMAYLNLMLRQPADYLDSKEDYDKNIAEADQWLQKYLDTKKIKAEREAKKAAGGIQQEAK
jgi:tetratricopeptide (TPR) repeat protein